MAGNPNAALYQLSEEFAALSRQMDVVAAQISRLQQSLPGSGPAPAAPTPVPAPPVAAAPQFAWQPPVYQGYPTGYPAMPYPNYPPPQPAPRPKPPRAPRLEGGTGWVAKVLAVMGVGVTLIGVVLLLVLAAQAGLLRPEIRVGGGAVLAAALVAFGLRWDRRPGGRTGAIALAATGIAAAYLDVIAVCTIYEWIRPAAGLALAFAIAGGGLWLTRRWDSEPMGLLVLIPLTVLAPVVTGSLDLLLIGFMLVASAASLPIQIGKDWLWLFAARTTVVTVPLLLAVVLLHFTEENPWYLGAACLVAAGLAIVGALVTLPSTGNRTGLALWAAAGVSPVLVAPVSVSQPLSVLMLATVSVALLGIVAAADRLPGVAGPVAQIWAGLSAVAALVAVVVAFEGPVRVAVLLAMGLVIGIGARGNRAARAIALGFTVFGALNYLVDAPPDYLVVGQQRELGPAVAILIASVLLVCCVAVLVRTTPQRPVFVIGGAVALYALTTFMVTAGVLAAGPRTGFWAGHVVATVCWVALAAAMFVLALRVREPSGRATLIAGGLALTAAALAKLFLFDLGTLDGMFRVVVFIVVGLILLGMGAGYARNLAQQDSAPTHP